MAFQMDEVWVYQGQLKVNEPNNEPEWTKVTGENKINWATYLQGPVQVGDSGSYSGVEATLMVGPDTEGGSSKSLRVNGDVDIKGDTDQTGDITQEGNYTQKGSFTSDTEVTASGITLTSRKDFDIPHPTKEGWRLRHVCLEGNEAGVYVRGRVRNKNVIYLPEYWEKLVDRSSITVSLTPIGAHQNVIVKRVESTQIHLQAQGGMPINCFYHVFGERIDGERLIAEYEGTSIDDYPGDNSQYTHNK
tara:strand:+ start:2016 stop:2756 length:741 start_codon:yes stop_codon:yes gene_type:complete